MDKLFEPSRKFIKSTNLYKFQTYLEQKLSKKFLNYNKLWLWTNKNPGEFWESIVCLLYTSPSPRDQRGSRLPASG